MPHDVSQVQPSDHINYNFVGGNAEVNQEARAIGVDGSIHFVKREGRAPDVTVTGDTTDAVFALNNLILSLTAVRDRLTPTAPKPQPVEPVTQVIPVEPCHGLRWGIGGEPVNDTNAVRRRAAAIRS